MVLQGRTLRVEDTAAVNALVAAHPDWSRRRLSQELCRQWNWRDGKGRIKDMAARSLLVKMEQRGLVALPARRRVPCNRMGVRPAPTLEWDSRPVEGSLTCLGRWEEREVSAIVSERRVLAAALGRFHYLGFRGTVGENLQYTVRDGDGRLLACLLFGSSAWKCRERDGWIGWTREQRERNLNLTTNNTRFLILPWVKVPCLAGAILGRVARRLSADWQNKYGHPIFLLETFVERDRFRGTAYRATNWMRVGATTGRTRQDRDKLLRRPVKDIYLYPLRKSFRKELCR
ncbi:MAG: Druantia anti-phage system protein DruA [Gammaproteobacteria bacterium]